MLQDLPSSNILSSDQLANLTSNWNKIVNAIKLAEYSFSINNEAVDKYRDRFESDGVKEYVLPSSEYQEFATVKIIFNDFQSLEEYRTSITALEEAFMQNYFLFIDDSTFSVGERLRFLHKLQDQLTGLLSDIFHFKGYGDLEGDRSTSYSLENDQNEQLFENHSRIIDQKVRLYTDIQFKLLKRLQDKISAALQFIPGRLIDNEVDKYQINFNLTRTEVILLLLAFRDSNIISGKHSNYELARFAEKNFLYNHSKLKGLQSVMSEFISNSKSSDTAFASLKVKLSSLDFKKK